MEISRVTSDYNFLNKAYLKLRRPVKSLSQRLISIIPSSPIRSLQIEKIGNKELMNGFLSLLSILPGSAKKTLIEDFNLQNKIQKFMGINFDPAYKTSLTKNKIKQDLDYYISERIKNGKTEDYNNIYSWCVGIKETNAFNPYRIAHNLPLIIVFDGNVYTQYKAEKPYEIIFARNDKFEAITAIYGNRGCPDSIIGKGGIRYYSFEEERYDKIREGVLAEGVRLAETMDAKNPFWDVLFDGGKTVIMERKPVDKRDVIIDWIKAMTMMGILGVRYIAGPDMGMGEDDMELIVDIYYKMLNRLGLEGLVPTTGQPIQKGGFPHKVWMLTGTGVVDAFLVALNYLPRRIDETPSIIIQGFGDVGGSIVRILNEKIKKGDINVKIVGLSDLSGGLYDPEGLNLEVLSRMAERGEIVENYTEYATLSKSEKAKKLDKKEKDQIPFLEADVFIPAAGSNVITSENINDFKAKIIVEGANNSVAMELEKEELFKRGILFIPGTVANGGGVFSSTEEILHRYFDGLQRILEKKEEYRHHVIDSVREFAFCATRALLKESKERKVSPSQVLEDWTGMLKREVYKLTEIVKKLDSADIISEELPLEDKDLMFEIYRRINLNRDRIPIRLARKFAIMATVREMFFYKRFYNSDALVNLLASGKEDEKREAIFILGRMRKKNNKIISALITALKEDPSPNVRKNAAEALAQLRAFTEAKEALETAANDSNELVRLNAQWALSQVGYF